MEKLVYRNIAEYIKCFNSQEELHSQILLNEQKHLSTEYRLSEEKMKKLLHSDFIEYGKSGRVYKRDDILNSIPLDTFSYEIKDIQYSVDSDKLIVNYVLLKNNNSKMMCISNWKVEMGTLKLVYFISEYF